MNRDNSLQLIASTRVVAIVRSSDAETALQNAEAIVEGGLPVIEVSLTTPGAADVITRLVDMPGVCAGAGTVMSVEDVHRLADLGVSFIVTPHLDEEIVTAGLERGLVMGPGVFTATECARALASGADLLKIFPAGLAGVSGMKALMDPFPQASWLPTGGINIDNAAEWLQAGATAVGVGSELTRGGSDRAAGQARKVLGVVSSLPPLSVPKGSG